MSSGMSIEYKSKAWLIMQCLKDFGPQPRHQLTVTNSDEEAIHAIKRLLDCNFVRLVGAPGERCYDLTLQGARKLRAVNLQNPDQHVAGPREVGLWLHDQDYQGHELKRTCMRPGAYDAFDKPSLISGKRVYRKGVPA